MCLNPVFNFNLNNNKKNKATNIKIQNAQFLFIIL